LKDKNANLSNISNYRVQIPKNMMNLENNWRLLTHSW